VTFNDAIDEAVKRLSRPDLDGFVLVTFTKDGIANLTHHSTLVHKVATNYLVDGMLKLEVFPKEDARTKTRNGLQN
jgi:uncharacterized protein (UPF0212 family)